MRYAGWSGAMVVLCIALLAGGLLVGCGDDNGNGTKVIVISDLQGTWVATEFTMTSNANPQMALDFLALGGGSSWEVDDAGAFTGRAFVPEAVAGSSLEIP